MNVCGTVFVCIHNQEPFVQINNNKGGTDMVQHILIPKTTFSNRVEERIEDEVAAHFCMSRINFRD